MNNFESPDERLFHAIEDNDMEEVEAAIRAGAKVNKRRSKDLSTPLTQAIYNQHIEIADKLIERGANVNSHGAVHSTPLNLALTKEEWEFASRLLELGADPNEQDEKKSGSRPILTTIEKLNYEMLEKLLRKGADADLAAIDGTTPLMHMLTGNARAKLKTAIEENDTATHETYYKICELLIGYTTHPDAKHKSGNTALMYAVENLDSRLVQMLVSSGVDLSYVKKEDNFNALHTLSRTWPDKLQAFSAIQIAEILIKAGIDHGALDKQGVSASDYLRAAGEKSFKLHNDPSITHIAEWVDKLIKQHPYTPTPPSALEEITSTAALVEPVTKGK